MAVLRRLVAVGCVVAICSVASRALGVDALGHGDPVAGVALFLVVVLAVAKVGGDAAIRIGQPAVLGELVCGVLVGNLSLLGIFAFEDIKADPFIDMLARIGVLLLLFEVGLESTVGQMLKVGLSSLLVASLGVVTPFLFGWGISAWLQPEAGTYVHIFVGATLTATSVGISARVLRDLGRARSREARVILGAAVIDDVMGLLILAVVTGMIRAAERSGTLSYGEIGVLVLKAGGFLVGALALGPFVSRRLFASASKLRAHGVLLAVALGFCFLMSWLANAIGLAPIVGAFAAGLVLEEVHYRELSSRGERHLEELIHPLSSFLAPVFFVVMGMRTDLGAFAQPGVWAMAFALCVVAIAGKQACALGVVERGIDRISVGIGMIPRGEVGLIFANMGAALLINGQPVVTPSAFSAVVVMVIVTTLVTPPALKWSLTRSAKPGR